MIKFNNYKLSFQEVPDEVSVCINITGCTNNCKNCHSPELQSDIGEELTTSRLDEIISKNKFATCITFMGGDNKELELIILLKYIKDKGLKTCLYSGNNKINENYKKYLNYYKYGEYNIICGSLKDKTTNQKFIDVKNNKDMTYMFWYK